MNDIVEDAIDMANAPAVPGLTFRRYRGESDLAHILEIINGSKGEDGLERADTLESITRSYSHLTHCDLSQDFILAEVDGKPVGYTRLSWEMEREGPWLGFLYGWVLPEWRRKGIGSAILDWAEGRLSQIAGDLRRQGLVPQDKPCVYSLEVYHSEKTRRSLLESRGYTIARQEHVMVRPDLENIPEAPMPPGLEARPAQPEHYRLIWEAAVEAFQDHWGFIPPSENGFEEFMREDGQDPGLWQVGWDGDQVAGSVLAYINNEENKEYGRLRGYSEGISVRRPWRRRGLARALLVRSLIEFKRLGMQEAALSVDTQNWNSAYNLYESVGFRIVSGYSYYQKPFQPAG
jgi:mycothiol synthase